MTAQRKFGLNVRQIRLENGWSQEDLADRSNLHRTYISGIERGTRNPSLNIIDQLAETFEVSITDLFQDWSR